MSRLAFIDFEASSLDLQSWPIEVGFATSGGLEDSFLLARQQQWSMAYWDRWSALLHGISVEDLDASGLQPAAAMARLKPLEGLFVVSDAPEFDSHWLGRICEAAGVAPPFPVNDWSSVLPSDLTRPEQDALLKKIRRRYPRHHRAGPDAQIMREVWREAWAGDAQAR